MDSSNVVLKAKWDAWTGCAGMPMETAMQEFIALIGKIEVQAKSRQTIAREIKDSNRSSMTIKSSSLADSKALSAVAGGGSTGGGGGGDAGSAGGGEAGGTSSHGSDTGSIAASITRQGTLYKQRDVFKGWRPRHFVLSDYFLQYYIEPDDVLPRNTLDLTGESAVTALPSIDLSHHRLCH